MTFGLAFDKQWLVQNSGTCNWNSSYRLKHIGGGALGAPEEITLYPARAGTQATIQIQFTAPFTEGVYESAWQAVDAEGSCVRRSDLSQDHRSIARLSKQKHRTNS